MPNDPKYPFVRCDAHPDEDEPGYAVCRHVIAGAPVARFELATFDSLGSSVCRECLDWSDPGNLVLCCAHAVRDEGWDHVTVH